MNLQPTVEARLKSAIATFKSPPPSVAEALAPIGPVRAGGTAMLAVSEPNDGMVERIQACGDTAGNLRELIFDLWPGFAANLDELVSILGPISEARSGGVHLIGERVLIDIDGPPPLRITLSFSSGERDFIDRVSIARR